MVVEKGLIGAAVVVFAGFVGYKLIKKKRPDVLKKFNVSVSDAKKRMYEIVKVARQSFREGYARA